MKAFALAALMTLAASTVFAFNLSDAANAVCSMQAQQRQGQVQAPGGQANLLNTLGSQLNITSEQAVGGAGAMLGLARNNLSRDEYGQLTKAVPGLDLLSAASTLGRLNGIGGGWAATRVASLCWPKCCATMWRTAATSTQPSRRWGWIPG